MTPELLSAPALADLFWGLLYLFAAVGVVATIHEVGTGLKRLFAVQRRARIFRKLRDLRTLTPTKNL